MSTNSNTEREGGASAGQGLVQAQVPRLVTGSYSAWRPVMENVLMRAGILARDYKVENKDWAALVAAVDRWAMDDESASIAHVLGRTSTSSSSTTSTTASTTTSTPAKEARRGAEEVVARTKKAYSMLFAALPEELRRLVAHVSQGDAYGLWSWLERRFQNTEQDNIGDLWDKFTGLSQESEQTFDEYKASVDHVYGLLAHAKDKPSAGLYAHRVLWKLSHRYNAAVLALKASGKLKDADKIDWAGVVAFINDHERSESRLNDDRDSEGSAMSVARTRGGRSHVANMDCYNCGEKGHMARDCKKQHRTHSDSGSEDSDNDKNDKRDPRHISWKKGDKNDKKDVRTKIIKAQRGGQQINAVFKKELPYDDPEYDVWNRTYTTDELDAMAENFGYCGKKQHTARRGGHQ